MKADFSTLAVLFNLILQSAGLAALGSLLSRKGVEDLVADLRRAIGPDRGDERPDEKYVARKVKALRGELFSTWMVLLHLMNLGILVAVVVVLVIGPEVVFSSAEGELAEPLSPAQLAVYWVWFALNVIGYVVKGASPTVQWFRLAYAAKAWLKKYGTQAGR